uniref:DUF4806 domain-containing protein n=1 Tax=Ascaris lumbricoides TaxID=6252 RepID=A0A0M3HS82_ASCLU
MDDGIELDFDPIPGDDDVVADAVHESTETFVQDLPPASVVEALFKRTGGLADTHTRLGTKAFQNGVQSPLKHSARTEREDAVRCVPCLLNRADLQRYFNSGVDSMRSALCRVAHTPPTSIGVFGNTWLGASSTPRLLMLLSSLLASRYGLRNCSEVT